MTQGLRGFLRCFAVEKDVPMSDETYQCFTRIISMRNAPKVEPMIQGKAGFLFFDKNEKPLVALHWEKYFEHICEKYNKTFKIQLPKVTPHVCRHTYCTDMARKGMNPKNLQYLMGHADIATTLNVYTHLGFEDAKNDLKKLKLLKEA